MNFHIMHDAHPDGWVQVSGHRVAVRNLFCELGFSFELVTLLIDTKEIPARIGPSLKGFTVVKTRKMRIVKFKVSGPSNEGIITANCDFQEVRACSRSATDAENFVKGAALHVIADWDKVPDTIEFRRVPG